MTTHSMCGIVTEDGRDCAQPVPPFSLLNLCADHLEQAHRLYETMAEPLVIPERDLERCPFGHKEVYPGVTGSECGYCGWKTKDYVRGRPVEIIRHSVRLPTKEPKPTGKHSVSVVYYIKFDNRIKIGTSGDVRRRILELPHDRVLGIEKGDYHLEQRRHAEFAHVRQTGEWFTATDELEKFATSLNTRRWSVELAEWERE